MATKSTAVKLTLKVTSFIVRLLMNLFFYILVVIVIINVSKFAYTFTYQLYGPDTVEEAPGRDIIIQIAKGESKMDIATKLELNHAIKSKYSFYLKTKLQDYVIMPGTYVINSSMTYQQILSVITDYTKSIDQSEEDKKAGDKASENSDSTAGTKDDTKEDATK